MSPRFRLYRFEIFILVFVGSWVAGCSSPRTGTETGNPDVATVGFRMLSSEPERIALQSGASAEATPGDEPSAFAIALAELGVQEVRFVTCNEGAESVGPFGVALDDVGAAMALSVEVPAGDYCSVELRLGPVVDQAKETLRLSGIRQSDGSQVTLLLSDVQSTTLRSASQRPVTFDEGARFLVTLDAARLVSDDLLAQAKSSQGDADATGIVLYEADNDPLARQVAEIFPLAFALSEDVDGDGQVSEQDDTLMIP